jgi:hypothetical protein
MKFEFPAFFPWLLSYTPSPYNSCSSLLLFFLGCLGFTITIFGACQLVLFMILYTGQPFLFYFFFLLSVCPFLLSGFVLNSGPVFKREMHKLPISLYYIQTKREFFLHTLGLTPMVTEWKDKKPMIFRTLIVKKRKENFRGNIFFFSVLSSLVPVVALVGFPGRGSWTLDCVYHLV